MGIAIASSLRARMTVRNGLLCGLGRKSGWALSPSIVVEGAAIFAVVALLQLPGKSNFGVITLSTHHPYRDVFVGSSVGLGGATVVSVTLGYGAETVLGPYLLWVKVVGGLVLVAFGIREILRAPAPERAGRGDPRGGPHCAPGPDGRSRTRLRT